MKKEIVCLCCPRSCCILVDEEKKVVTGNYCAKGKKFAFTEVTCPRRTLTSTIKVMGGTCELVPVKTNTSIDKRLFEEFINKLRSLTVKAPVHLGDTVIENVLGTKVNIVATMDVEEKESEFL